MLLAGIVERHSTRLFQNTSLLPCQVSQKMKFPLTRNSDFFCEMEWAVLFKPLFLQLFCTRRKGITAGGKLCVCVLVTSASVRCSAVQVQYKRGLVAVCAVCNLQLVICVICVICAYCSVQKKKTKAKGIDGGGLSLWVFLSPTPHLQSHYGRLLGMYKVLNISQRIRNSFPPGKLDYFPGTLSGLFYIDGGPLILKFLLLIWHWALALASIVLNSFEMW